MLYLSHRHKHPRQRRIDRVGGIKQGVVAQVCVTLGSLDLGRQEAEPVVADQIVWARSTPNFKPCFKNWSSNAQNTVHRYPGTPSAKLGGWGHGGGVRLSGNHKPPVPGSLYRLALAGWRTIRILGKVSSFFGLLFTVRTVVIWGHCEKTHVWAISVSRCSSRLSNSK